MTTGIVFDIKKFAINDGPGIRTAVFLKGCPLHCLWCHNPESLKSTPEIYFMPDKCIGCGWCFQVCPEHAHVMENGKHVFMRDKCIRCGKCAEKCYAGALEVVGRRRTVEEVLCEVLKDRAFYENSNGGMTVSGGEPMAQFEFTFELCRAAKKEGLHVALDTSGFASWEKYEKLFPYVDLYLYDVKATDPEKHKKFTNVSNELIRENLHKIDDAGGKTILRCPLVPGLNDNPEHLAGIADLANSLKNVQEIDIEPYHPLGLSKCARLGEKITLNLDQFTSEEKITEWISAVSAKTAVKVIKS